MSHYEILGVPIDATPAELLQAYRKLVKRYHPDTNKSDEAAQFIIRIKEAYEVLSDPKKRNSYDRSYPRVTFVEEEDPRDRAKRELLKKKKRKELRRKEIRTKWRKRTFAIFRGLSFPILALAFALVVDDWLPPLHLQEVAVMGWQERETSFRYSKEDLITYMKTKSFEFMVPPEVHLGYDYYGHPPKLLIRVTPIFQTMRKIYVTQNGKNFSWTVQRTVYNFILPWPYVLLVSALFTVLLRNYNRLSYTFCFLPTTIICIMFILFWR